MVSLQTSPATTWNPTSTFQLQLFINASLRDGRSTRRRIRVPRGSAPDSLPSRAGPRRRHLPPKQSQRNEGLFTLATRAGRPFVSSANPSAHSGPRRQRRTSSSTQKTPTARFRFWGSSFGILLVRRCGRSRGRPTLIYLLLHLTPISLCCHNSPAPLFFIQAQT
jgi:hypothetical protein